MRFRRIRAQSLQLQNILNNHILTNDSKEFFAPGVTYGECLRQLQRNHSLYLSEKIYVKLKNSRSTILMQKTDRILDEQEQTLNNLEKSATLAENVHAHH